MVHPTIIERFEEEPKRKGRGRPKGAKNKFKLEAVDAQGHESGFRPVFIAPHESKPIAGHLKTVQTQEEEYQLVDSLLFTDDKQNTIEITLRQKKNRVYRMQIFLNGDRELRPITYNGSITAITFWNMLKGTLNK